MTLLERYRHAISFDHLISVTRGEAPQHMGFGLERFQDAGLSRSDLIKLVRKGYALRGWTRNIYFPGEKLNGRVVPGEWKTEVAVEREIDTKATAAKPPGYRPRTRRRVIERPRPTETSRAQGHRVRYILISDPERGWNGKVLAQ